MKSSCDKWLFIKPRVQESETKCGKFRERGTFSLGIRGISPRIPGNIIILISREKFKKIAGNVRENSG